MIEQKANHISITESVVPIVPMEQRNAKTEIELSEALSGETERMLISACSSSADNSDLLFALEYHLESGGGRSRASICLSASMALGLDSHDSQVLAVCAELLHNASLIQDDLQDQDTNRRGRPAVWHRFGRNVALGLVDLMISSSFKSLTHLNRVEKLPQLICKLHEAISETLQGQSMDTAEIEFPSDFQHCLSVAQKKSGPLFALSLELPLLAAGLEQRTYQAFKAACAFGTGYQIYDDILDFDFDRRNSHSNNVVCALNETVKIREAIIQAISISRRYLNESKMLAESLPEGCGHPLVIMAEKLQLKLNEFDL